MHQVKAPHDESGLSSSLNAKLVISPLFNNVLSAADREGEQALPK
jgi:hypothetical protein